MIAKQWYYKGHKYDLSSLIDSHGAPLCSHVHYDHCKPSVVVGHSLDVTLQEMSTVLVMIYITLQLL